MREWTTLDLIASYTFNLPSPATAEVPGLAKDGGKNMKMPDGKEKNVLPVSTAQYNPCGWRAWLNGTTLTLGMQNVFDSDPPFVAGAFENNYDESIADDQRPVLVRPANEEILKDLLERVFLRYSSTVRAVPGSNQDIKRQMFPPFSTNWAASGIMMSRG